MELERIKLLEELLKEAHNIASGDYPYYGRTTQVWVGDKIDRMEETNQRKVNRGKK